MVERTPGPFEYYPDLHAGVTGDSIRSDTEDPGLDAATIQALSAELEGDSRAVGQDLSGDITAAVQKNPRELSGQAATLAASGFYAVGLVNRFAGMVDTFDTTVNGLNHRYRTDLAMAMRWAGQAAASTPDTTDDATVDEAHMGPGIRRNLQPEYDKAVSKLDADADGIAADFRAGVDNKTVRELIRQGLIPLDAAVLYAGLTLTPADRRAYYGSLLGAMTTQEQIDWVNAHKDALPPEAAGALRPEVQEHFAEQIATDIKDPEKIDADTVRFMAFFQTEEAFATRLYTSVTPDEMGEAIKQLNYQVFGVGDPRTDYTGRQFDGPADLDLYDGFMNAAGVTLATYSRSVDDPSSLADDWFGAITDDDNPENAAALTLLVREGGEQRDGRFDATFIDRLTSKVTDWERDQDGPVWGPRAQETGIWIRDPDKVTVTEFTDQYGRPAYTVSGGVATDGLANLLGGMAHSPEGAQRYFTTADGTVDQDRLDYLMLERTFSESSYSDEGDGLGEALQAAVVGEDARDATGTSIANSLFTMIAEHGGEADSTFDNKWHVWPGMTDSLGTIAAGYSDDLYDMLSNTPPQSGATHLAISQDVLSQVLGEIGRPDDKAGLETLTTAMLMETRDRNVDFLDGVTGPREVTRLASIGYEGLQNTNGNVLGNLLNYGLDLAEDEDRTDAARAAMLSKAIDIAGGFVPGAGSVLGPGASHLATATYDAVQGEALSQISDSVKGSPSSTTDAYRDGAESEVPRRLYANAISDLYRTSFLEAQDTPTGRYAGVDDDLFTGQPPTLRPDLSNSDGYALSDDTLSAAEKERILQHYRDLKTSPIWSLVEQNSYSGNFYDRINHPEEMAGVGD